MDEVVFLKFFWGRKHDFCHLFIESEDIERVERGREKGIGIVVGDDRFGAADVVDKTEDEVLFLAGLGNADILDGDETPFFRDDETDEVE